MKIRHILVVFLCIMNFILVDSFASEADGAENNVNSPSEQLLGFIKRVYNEDNKIYLEIDCVEWLTGREAIRAGIEDDKHLDEIDKTRLLEQLEETDLYDWRSILDNFRKYIPPNDFYISNQSNEIKIFEVSSDVQILMHTFSHAPDGNFNRNESIDLLKFKEIIDGTVVPNYLKDGNVASTYVVDLYKKIPFHIKLSNGLVIEIMEQYVP